MKKLLAQLAVTTLAASAAVVAFAAPSSATLHPTGCDDPGFQTRLTLLQEPVLLQVSSYENAPNWANVRVCVGTEGGSVDRIAYEELDLRVHPYGSQGPAGCNPNNVPDNYTGVGTDLVAEPGSIGANAGVGVSTSPQVCVLPDGTLTVYVPVTFCLGGTCPVNNVSGSIGKTGVVVGTITPTGPPSGTGTGGGVHVDVDLWVDGLRIPISGTYAAGVALPSAGLSQRGTLVCGPLNLVCVPGAAGIYYGGGPALGVTVASIPVLVPVPVGYTCVPLFRFDPHPSAC